MRRRGEVGSAGGTACWWASGFRCRLRDRVGDAPAGPIQSPPCARSRPSPPPGQRQRPPWPARARSQSLFPRAHASATGVLHILQAFWRSLGGKLGFGFWCSRSLGGRVGRGAGLWCSEAGLCAKPPSSTATATSMSDLDGQRQLTL